MSDVLDKVKWELEGDWGRPIISEEELVESLSMLDSLAEVVESCGGNTKPIHGAIKGLAMLWGVLFGKKTEVKVNDR